MAKEFRGLLTPKEEKWLARFIDRSTPFKNKIVEKCDYFFYVNVIRLLDNCVLDKTIPGNWINPLRKIIEMAKAKDTKGIGELMASTAAGAIDIPFLSDNGEKLIFLHAYGLLEAQLYQALIHIENKNKT